MTGKEKALLYRILCLENTRLIFDGVAGLHRQLLDGRNGETLNNACRTTHIKICPDTTNQTIEAELSRILDESCDKDGRLLKQNINYSFLAFWETYFDETDHLKMCHSITKMLLYYDLLHRLVEPDSMKYSKDEMPYCCEKLCSYISAILDCESCLVFHFLARSAQLVCRSPYHNGELESGSEFTSKDFSALLERPEEDREVLTDDIFQMKQEGKRYIVIHLAELDDQQEEKLFLVLQGVKDGEKLEDNIRPLSKVLFARARLKETLIAQYEHLLNLRFDCGFVQFFDNALDIKDSDRYPAIMHISDIHMDMLLHNDELMNSLIEQMRANKEYYGKVDLLAISGDLIEARYSTASQIQENYDYLKELLRKIVTTLWDRGDGTVSFDWRRRILIVPGNHDFAAVNLFKTILRNRAVAAHIPSPGKNKIMAKFSYYLDFIQSFLDAPIDELMRDHINEVREYRHMNTKVLLLNSSFGATAQRTNKVTLDSAVTNRLTDTAAWRKQAGDHFYRVCVVHHPPFNPIDYVLDGYDTVEGWKWSGVAEFGSMNSLYAIMKMAVHEIQEEEHGHIGEHGRGAFKSKFESEYRAMEKEGLIQKSLGAAYANGKTYFTKDAQLLYEYFQNEGTVNSEDATNMINRILYDMETSNQDVKTYTELVKSSIKDADIFLCGHTHADNEIPDGKPGTALEKRVSVIRKFAYDSWEKDSEKKLHFRIICPYKTANGVASEIKQY